MRLDRQRPLLSQLHIDPPLVGGLVMICAIGLVTLYSASGETLDTVLRQGARMVLGFTLMLGVAQVSPQRLAVGARILRAGGYLIGPYRTYRDWPRRQSLA